jgi:hypothetical protein
MASYLETGFAHLHHCTATRSVSEHNAPLRLLCLTPAIDEALTGYAGLIGELDPVLLINFCNPFADCRLTFDDQFVRW